VASLGYTERALADLARLAALLESADASMAGSTLHLILDGLAILSNHPLIGRSSEPPYRELVISRGKTGYIALYAFDEAHDRVMVHAIRHQREAGFEE
jgi:plasmid stabilization system protein ParE